MNRDLLKIKSVFFSTPNKAFQMKKKKAHRTEINTLLSVFLSVYPDYAKRLLSIFYFFMVILFRKGLRRNFL